MVKYLLLYLIVFVAFLVIDLIWLGVVARKFYRDQLGFIMVDKINWPAALSFYLLFIAGLIYFVVLPSLGQGSWSNALLNGAFLGLLCYATYDLSNLATLKNWPLKVTIADLIWGSVLCGSLSVIGFFAGRVIF
jgi:uncharacterized membrane protein